MLLLLPFLALCVISDSSPAQMRVLEPELAHRRLVSPPWSASALVLVVLVSCSPLLFLLVVEHSPSTNSPGPLRVHTSGCPSEAESVDSPPSPL